MIQQPVHPFIQAIADPLDAFDIYYIHNLEQVQSLIYSKGYNQHDNEGLGSLEQYENGDYFIHDYPGETLFYHLLMVKDAVNPQTKLTWFMVFDSSDLKSTDFTLSEVDRK